MRFQRALLGNALHLRDNNAAIVTGGQCLIQPAESGSLMLISEIAVFISRCCTNNGDLRYDIGKIEPFFIRKFNLAHNRLPLCCLVHGAALPVRIDKSVQSDFSYHSGSFGSSLTMHIKQNAGRHIIGRNFIRTDHLPDQRRFCR